MRNHASARPRRVTRCVARLRAARRRPGRRLRGAERARGQPRVTRFKQSVPHGRRSFRTRARAVVVPRHRTVRCRSARMPGRLRWNATISPSARSTPITTTATSTGLPYGDAESYPVIQGYGSRLSHRGTEHYTVDFGMPVGTPVHAARDGVVALAEDSHDVGCWREECGRLANFIVVLHADGTTGEYFHLAARQRAGPARAARRARRAARVFREHGLHDGAASALRRLPDRTRRRRRSRSRCASSRAAA